MTQWSFTLQVPFSKLNAELSTLGALQQSFEKKLRSLSYFIQGMQVSPQLAASQTCSYPGLLEDAGAQARVLATAAGLAIGPVVAVSVGTGSNPLPTAVFPALGFNTIPIIRDPLFVSGIIQTPMPQTTCAMTVQYKLLR
jgi:hypothetical protein